MLMRGVADGRVMQGVVASGASWVVCSDGGGHMQLGRAEAAACGRAARRGGVQTEERIELGLRAA
jgi:hypothetical protein